MPIMFIPRSSALLLDVHIIHITGGGSVAIMRDAD